MSHRRRQYATLLNPNLFDDIVATVIARLVSLDSILNRDIRTRIEVSVHVYQHDANLPFHFDVDESVPSAILTWSVRASHPSFQAVKSM
jgi:hypothetical protein